MKILVIAEISDGILAEDQTNKTIFAASGLSNVDVLCASNKCEKAAEQLQKIDKIDTIKIIESDLLSENLAESFSEDLIKLITQYTHIFVPSTSFGKNLLPRLAGILDVMIISDVVNIVSEDTFERPVYAGNAIQKVQSIDKIKLISIRTSNFVSASSNGNAKIEILDLKIENNLSKWIENKLQKTDRPELTSAKVIVSGGRGVGSKENFDIIEKLADKLGAAVGASRAAVDSGFAPNDWQVGQTGKVVAPELYVAVGISGAIQHLAGMKDSKVIIAINKDEEAPIFQVADFGLVEDLFKAVPEIEKKIGS
jgi:electron transfer flavoprotein alpha subunit